MPTRPLLAALALLVAGCGGAAAGGASHRAASRPPVLRGPGVSLRLAAGWDERATQGRLAARHGRSRLVLMEASRDPPDPGWGRFPRTALPLRLDRTPRQLTVRGRRSLLLVRPAGPSGAISSMPESLCAPRRFDRGRVAAPAFARAAAWDAGHTPATHDRPEGDWQAAWASTAPFRDPPEQVPPHATLARLPRSGIVLRVELERDGVAPLGG